MFKTRDRHYGIRGEFNIDKCDKCGFVFLNPMPSEKYLNSLYPEAYYAYQDFYEKQKGILKKIYSNFVDQKTYDPEFITAGNILDLGCGSGKYLYKFKKKGWNVYGVEVNKSAAKLGNDLEQLNIHSGNLISAQFENDFFDYVRSNHSFEHIVNPKEVLTEIRRILKPTGKLFIGVPNISSFNAKIFKKYWWYLGAPVHTYNYSVSTLKRLLEQQGFKVEKVLYNGDLHGILGSFQIYLNRNRLEKKSTEGFFINNILFKISSSIFAKILNKLGTGDSMQFIASKK
ncbi:MAG: class I SAM-dependent methyltransferase [Niabella sp.]